MKKSFAQILEDEKRTVFTKVAAKLPSEWVSAGLEYPGSLSLEQCSSEETALHKAGIIPCRKRVADLTGGLGMDSWAFSNNAEAVFYNERNLALREAVERNFIKLGVRNTEFHSFDIDITKPEWKDALEAYSPDWIYLDPARRGVGGQKVFRPEDCQPNVVELVPELLRLAPEVMVKLSPMADITMLCNLFQPYLRKLEIIESSIGEVKEILCILEREPQKGEIDIAIITGGKERLTFRRSEEEKAKVNYADSIRGFLFEPHASVLKAGIFRLCCNRFNVRKIAPSTHLYIGDGPLGEPLFKEFEILESLPFGKSALFELGKRYPHAEVTSRNLPLRSEELRSRMKITDGNSDGIHIFGCDSINGKALIVTKKFVNTK